MSVHFTTLPMWYLVLWSLVGPNQVTDYNPKTSEARLLATKHVNRNIAEYAITEVLLIFLFNKCCLQITMIRKRLNTAICNFRTV